MGYDESYQKTMGHEGGYSNDPDDAGAETYKGISRRFHPTWPGWGIIDLHKKDIANFPKNLTGLSAMVKSFYKENFWDKFAGDEVAGISPDLASEMFDNAVNMGVGRSVRFIQKGLNVLNRTQLLYNDLTVDGAFGGKSLAALEKLVESDPVELLIKVLNILQGAHYIKYMGKDPVQEKYARGWLSRVSL